MKNLIKTTIITSVLAFGLNPLYASGGHDHGHGHSHSQTEVSKKVIQKKATQEITRLIKAGKIDKTWADISVAKIEKKKFHHGMEWVLNYKDSKTSDKSKQTLYIFINIYGHATGANFTGN